MRAIILVIAAVVLLILGGLGGWWLSAISQASPSTEHHHKKPKTLPGESAAALVQIPQITPAVVVADAPIPVLAKGISAPIADLIDRLAKQLAHEIGPRGIDRTRMNSARLLAGDGEALQQRGDALREAMTSDHPEITAHRLYAQMGQLGENIGDLKLTELGSYNRAVKAAKAAVLPTIEHDQAAGDSERAEMASIVNGVIVAYLQRSYATWADPWSEVLDSLIEDNDGHAEMVAPQQALIAAFLAYQDAFVRWQSGGLHSSVAANQRAKDEVDAMWTAYASSMQAFLELRLSLVLRKAWQARQP